MSAPVPYLLFPGNARDALLHYAEIFGGEARMHTYAEMGRADGPGDAIGHGMLVGGPVEIAGADAGPDEDAVTMGGMFLSLLGTANADTLTEWFTKLADGGRILDLLQQRPWGAHDGTLVDPFGVRWLIGYEDE